MEGDERQKHAVLARLRPPRDYGHVPDEKSIRDAFEASDDLWVEADIVGGDMDYMTEKMMYSDGTTLKDHVSAETYSKLQRCWQAWGCRKTPLIR